MKFFNIRLSKIKIALILIVILGSALRFWQIGNTPPSPDWDEAALGYDAYSILHTGKDEFGKFLPVVLRSFDDYKPALYAYTAIPSVAIFGLNVASVRIPSAIFGVISIISVFFLCLELFKDNKYKNQIALACSFLFAISPWSIQFSRVAFEANVGDSLNILATLFFLKGLRSPKLLLLSALLAGLSIYSYQSEKAFVPLLFLALFLIYRKDILKINKKTLFLSFFVGLITVIPMAYYIFTNSSALLRLTGTSIFSYKTELLKNNIDRLNQDKNSNDLVGLVLDNRRTTYIVSIVSGYVSHFDPNWLFVKGDITRHHAPDMGMFYLFEFPLIVLGIYYLLFGEFDKKTKLFVFAWLLISPIPAAVTVEVPHAVRTLNFLPSWQILSAIGLFFAYKKISGSDFKVLNLKIRYLILTIFIAFSIFNFLYYLNQYFVQLDYYNSSDWQYGYKQAVELSLKDQDKYTKIVVSDNQPLDKSYMFFLFYLKYPPSDYQKIGEKSAGGYNAHHHFGKYEFRPIDWEKDKDQKDVLYIGGPQEIPEISSFKTINNLDKTPAIRMAKT